MKKVFAISAALLISLATAVEARETPRELECENIERTHNALQEDLRVHLEGGAPQRVDIDYDQLIKFLVIPLDWFADSVHALWTSSVSAYEADIREMRARGRDRNCPWAQEVPAAAEESNA